MKKYRKIFALSFMLTASSCMGFVLHEAENQSKLWLAASTVAGHNYSEEAGIGIGLLGIGQGTLWAYGFALGTGGPATVAVGAAFAL